MSRFAKEFFGLTPIDECRVWVNMLLCGFAALVGWMTYRKFGYNPTVIIMAVIAGSRFARGKTADLPGSSQRP